MFVIDWNLVRCLEDLLPNFNLLRTLELTFSGSLFPISLEENGYREFDHGDTFLKTTPQNKEEHVRRPKALGKTKGKGAGVGEIRLTMSDTNIIHEACTNFSYRWSMASFVGLVPFAPLAPHYLPNTLWCNIRNLYFPVLIMSTTLVAEKSLVGTIDIVLLASFIGVLLYWFCGRKKKTETAALTQKLVLA